MAGDGAMRVEDLHAGYGGRAVLRGLTLPPMQSGRLVALVGPNAAGKSTLLRALAQLLPSRGQMRLGAEDLASLSAGARARTIGFMPQHQPAGIALSVLEAVLTVLRAAGAERGGAQEQQALAVLERLQIGDLASCRLGRLSGGQRQVAGLAQAIACAPPLLLLDEPTSALDPARQFQVMSMVQAYVAEGRIAIAVLHDLTLAAQWADDIVVLSEGRLHAAGPPEAVVTPAILAEVYGIDARVERCSKDRLQIMIDGVASRHNRLKPIREEEQV